MTKRAIHDFGKKMVANAKDELVRHFSTADIDEVSELLLSKASNDFLDKALAMRLRTIEAMPLINALAKAERLGYDPGDIVEQDQRHGQEHVIPRPQYPSATTAATPPNGVDQSTPQPQKAGSGFQCAACYRTFQAQSAFDHVCSLPNGCDEDDTGMILTSS